MERPIYSSKLKKTPESQLLYEQLRHMDIRHFVILECRHLANGCVLKYGCNGLMLFLSLSCLGTTFTTGTKTKEKEL